MNGSVLKRRGSNCFGLVGSISVASSLAWVLVIKARVVIGDKEMRIEKEEDGGFAGVLTLIEKWFGLLPEVKFA